MSVGGCGECMCSWKTQLAEMAFGSNLPRRMDGEGQVRCKGHSSLGEKAKEDMSTSSFKA
jgi:hypothetical protein